jgi:hypothetical protein
MSEYIPILIIDQDDTSQNETMTLREFLAEIDFHVNNVEGATLDNVFVKLDTVDYEDEDFYEISIAEIRFSVKK